MEETARPRWGTITKFVEWHARLTEMDQEFTDTLTSEEWSITPQARRVRNALVALDKIALANGATRWVAGSDDEGKRTYGVRPNPAYDWDRDQIDYEPAEGRWDLEDLRGDALVAELVAVTGIAE